MKIGDLLLTQNPCWLRDDPIRRGLPRGWRGDAGGGIPLVAYPQGTMVTLLQEDDPEVYYHKVLTPDGKTGWIYKGNLELIHETR